MLFVAFAFACYLGLFAYLYGGAWADARRRRAAGLDDAFEAYDLRRREDRLQHFAAVRADELEQMRRAQRRAA